ncbi:hypothetical protein KY284_007912 [Solanum tuberosum]|nr:hypothetical protein KY284_007912 [Solanum tuberosum]
MGDSSTAMENMRLPHVIMSWWYSEGPSKLRMIYKTLPTVITWVLWRRRNSRKHGGDLTLHVKWEMPCEGVIKCNTDGACRGNPGTGTYGFCLRNTVGDLIYAEAEKIGVTTNVEAEMRAIVEAVRYYVRVGIRKIVIESDSILMVKIINGIWKVPWEIAEWFEELK